MIIEQTVITLLKSLETYRIERTRSLNNTDKFCQAICAFSNDLPNSALPGYLLIGVNDDGSLNGLKISDKLMKDISGIRSSGNILPMPVMTVESFSFPEGDVLVVEVQPSLYPPVRYRGRVWIRIGPRKDIASEAEERILTERRTASMPSFDTVQCLNASVSDLDTELFQKEYLPKAVDKEALLNDKRSLEEQMASLRLYNLNSKTPTFAGLLLLGKNPEYYLPGAYIQYVRFAGLRSHK